VVEKGDTKMEKVLVRNDMGNVVEENGMLRWVPNPNRRLADGSDLKAVIMARVQLIEQGLLDPLEERDTRKWIEDDARERRRNRRAKKRWVRKMLRTAEGRELLQERGYRIEPAPARPGLFGWLKEVLFGREMLVTHSTAPRGQGESKGASHG